MPAQNQHLVLLVLFRNTYIVDEIRTWPFEQIVARQETSHISDRRLEKAHRLIICADAPIDVRNVVNDLVHDLGIAHDKGG